VVQDSNAVARCFGVKRHPSVVVAPEQTQSSQDPVMNGSPAMSNNSLLDRQPRDFMPESQPLPIFGQQARRQQFIERRRPARRDGLQQIQFHSSAHERSDIQYLSGLGTHTRDASKHSVAR
jgi:hypothetical protein